MNKKPFTSYISASKKASELTFKSITLGIILSLFFFLANTYLGLKVGMTISASIPSAVLSLAILKGIFKKASILEHNIVQTIGSVGEGFAAGVIFVLPALFLMDVAISSTKIFLLTFCGGLLGILFMIPMRRYLIVKEHDVLPYPEGTACAEILKTGESGAKEWVLTLFGGLLGVLYKIGSSALLLWQELIVFPLQTLHTQIRLDVTPSLIGVGMIIGPRIAAVVFSGSAIAWWVLIPFIKMFSAMGTGGELTQINASTPIELWSSYLRYLGVGAIAVGGLFSLARILPLLGKSLHLGVRELINFKRTERLERTDQDIPMSWLILGPILIGLFLWLYPGLNMNWLTILLLIFLGYFFSAVTSITVGIVGSSSNPASGMIITSLLITGGLYNLFGWSSPEYVSMAITMAAAISVSVCLACTTSQDLKTGYLLGATPIKQQIAEIFGLIIPALITGLILMLLNTTYGFGSTQLPAPQATLMKIVAFGIIEHQLPTTLVTLGAVLGVLAILLRIPVLPFALGIYLPIETTSVLFLGGILSYLIQLLRKKDDTKRRNILIASGLVAGDACLGVFIALLAGLGLLSSAPPPPLPHLQPYHLHPALPYRNRHRPRL